MLPSNPTRIVLIHATPVSISPIEGAFQEIWPEAERVNLLDDSLGKDVKAAGGLNQEIADRIANLADYGCLIGAQGILYTCSAFGASIDRVKQRLSIPVLKPNEAMLEEALALGVKIGILSSFAPTVASMEGEFSALTRSLGKEVELITVLREDAFSALLRGDVERHNRLLCDAAQELRGCDAVLLAQFSTALAAESLRTCLDCPVLTSPSSAVERMRQLLSGNSG